MMRTTLPINLILPIKNSAPQLAALVFQLTLAFLPVQLFLQRGGHGSQSIFERFASDVAGLAVFNTEYSFRWDYGLNC